MRIIINSDDFGISRESNLAIADAIKERICTNTTLMVNMPFADEAVKLAFENGFCEKVGLHINLTYGVPLSHSIKGNKKFCDENGRFNGNFLKSKTSRLYLNILEIKQVREEIDAQLKKFKDYKLGAIHVDSHHHSHTNYPIWLALKPLVKKHKIKSVRISRNLNGGLFNLNGLYKKIYNYDISKKDICTTDYFGSMNEYIGNTKRMKSEDVVEIMVHLSYKDNIIIDKGGCEEKFRYEVSKLEGNELISYNSIISNL